MIVVTVWAILNFLESSSSNDDLKHVSFKLIINLVDYRIKYIIQDSSGWIVVWIDISDCFSNISFLECFPFRQLHHIGSYKYKFLRTFWGGRMSHKCMINVWLKQEIRVKKHAYIYVCTYKRNQDTCFNRLIT